ncbi:hypothetical protein CNR22_15230 [Sphingobacteriaceae bacterium]|nr:hypothetical protein CNR22_15230 [Sphingobacteriaceae bacterium]
MELVIKLYSDKPSKIGIKYPNEYTAVRAYEEIFHKNGGEIFSLKIEFVKERLTLTLISDETGERVIYKELEYKLEHLKKLQAFIQEGADLEFVHVFSKVNILYLAKAFRSKKFIKLSSYEIIGPANFANGF